jgi:uncharacterized protein
MPGKMLISSVEERSSLPVFFTMWTRAGVREIPQVGYGDEWYARYVATKRHVIV